MRLVGNSQIEAGDATLESSGDLRRGLVGGEHDSFTPAALEDGDLGWVCRHRQAKL
jgi:hypothetical protein